MATAAPDPDFLARALAKFTPRRRQLGLALATAQRVRFSAIAERSVRAVVSDERSHNCQIEWTKNGDLAARCDCRARFFCEHTAALVLAEINRRQHANAAAAAAPVAPPANATPAPRPAAPKPAAPKPAAPRPAAAKPAATSAPKPKAKPAAPATTKAPSAAATSAPAANRAPARPPTTKVAAVRRPFREEPPTLRERVAAIRGWLQQEPDEGNRRALELHLQLGRRIASATLPVVIYVVHEGPKGTRLEPLGSNHQLAEFGGTARSLLRRLHDLADSSSAELPPARVNLREPWASTLLPDLIAHTRCRIDLGDEHGDGGRAAARPELTIDDGGPFSLQLRLERSTDRLTLHGWLLRADERIGHESVRCLLAHYALLADRGVATAIDSASQALARDLLVHGPMSVPADQGADLLRLLTEFSSRVPELQPLVAVDDAPPPRAIVVIDTRRQLSNRFVADVRFDYDGTQVQVDDEPILAPTSPDGRMRRRNTTAERAAIAAVLVAGAGDLTETGMAGSLLLSTRQLSAVVDRLSQAGLLVQVDETAMRSSTGTRLQVRTGIDWFELEGSIAFGEAGVVPIATALASLAAGDRVVVLPDGSRGLLPEGELQALRTAARLGETKGGTLRLRRNQALLLDALLAARSTTIDADAPFRALRDRLQGFTGVAEREAPPTFRGTLRQYQQKGLGWLHFLRELQLGGCLADDMGLGKTVQVLALLAEVHNERTGLPTLLVAPRSLLDNWCREAERFAPALRVLDFHGTDRWQRLEQGGGFGAFDLVVTTYGTARLDAARFDDLQQQFEYAVLDEAQAIENATSLTSKAVRLLRSNHRLCLTGTPVQNHLGELWALFEFLNPGLLGKGRAFQEVLKGGGDGSGNGIELAALRRALAPFLLRRTKAEVLPDLPQKQEQQILCEMDDAQQQAYDALRAHYQQKLLQGNKQLDARERFVALEALLRLRQLACHERLANATLEDGASCKLDALVPMLLELAQSGHKALVFSQFTSFLALLRQRLATAGLRYEYLDGQTDDRQARVDRFQNEGDCPLFLISLKAGGFGLNLTAADYVFLLDPWWNPAAEAQAADRAHRIGQTRKVTVYRLITKGTVEEKVLALQAQKRQLVDAVLGNDQSLLASLTREDLAALLG